MKYLDDEVEGTVSDSVMHRLRERATDRTNAVWERLGGSVTPSAQYSRLRAAMLERSARSCCASVPSAASTSPCSLAS